MTALRGKPRLCKICGSPRQPNYQYCPRCKRLIGKGVNKRLRVRALQQAWSAKDDGFLCRYTGQKLEEYDTSSPWYITYDHVIPRSTRGGFVACAYWVNNMKTDLCDDELWAVVMEFDRHVKGAPFNRDIVKFEHWTRHAFRERALRASGPERYYKVDHCDICGAPPVKNAKYCARCKRRWLHFPGRVRAMKAAWCPEKNGFLDHYLGVVVDEENPDSPYYIVFDHRIPRKKGDLHVASMLVNAMKGDMSEDEFYRIMNELARHREGKPFDRDVIKFEYWKRW